MESRTAETFKRLKIGVPVVLEPFTDSKLHVSFTASASYHTHTLTSIRADEDEITALCLEGQNPNPALHYVYVEYLVFC